MFRVALLCASLIGSTANYDVSYDPDPPGPPQEDCSFLPYPQSVQCLREQHRQWCNDHYVRPSAEWAACMREDV